MSRHSDFFMHYDDNSCPLNDIFADSDNHVWTGKAPEIPGTKLRTEGCAKDVTSVTDSIIDIQLLDGAVKSSLPSAKAFTGHSSMFHSFPRDGHEFRVMTNTNQDSSLCVDSDHLNADQESEETGFSGYFSETRTENKQAHLPTSNACETNTQKLATPVDDVDSPRVSDSDGFPNFLFKEGHRKEVQKPPTTAGIKLEHLKAVFHLERPKAEKKLGLKRTTFSNLSRHYGISKWPFRTIRDALNRMEANKRILDNGGVSKERRRKLQRQQKLLHDVIDLIYKDPQQSRDSNTLAVLLVMVAAKDSQLR